MTNKTLPTLSAGSAVSASDKFLTRQGSDTDDKYATASQIKTFTTTSANQISADAAGTVYSLTNTQAAVDFGTTDPSVTISAVGTYLLIAKCVLDYNGATFAAVRTATMKLRRTNNTAADVTNSSIAVKTQIVTTLTGTMAQVTLHAYYTTANANDVISLFGALDVAPTAGSLDVSSASIYAIRLQQ